MFAFLSDFFQKNQIDTFGALPLDACRITRPYLLERAGIKSGTVVLFAVPYLTPPCLDPNRNLSAYAVSRDYHAYFAKLFDELLPALKAKFPQARFVGFSDHSPIAEIDAASRAGLGVIGQNRLLLTERYSSYVFLGEIITDLEGAPDAKEPTFCQGCGLCKASCPMETIGTCLSALTQKKGDLTKEETEAIRKHGSAWGCDLCQVNCPHTKKAIQEGTVFSPIPYFSQLPVSHLSTKDLEQMTDEEFSRRAYAWRGRQTILRNLHILEDVKGESPC